MAIGDEDVRLAGEDEAPVLHRTPTEARHGDPVQFGKGEGDAEEGLVVGEGGGEEVDRLRSFR